MQNLLMKRIMWSEASVYQVGLSQNKKVQSVAISLFHRRNPHFEARIERSGVHLNQEEEQSIGNKWDIWKDKLIPDLLHIQPPLYHDARGYLMETFDTNVFQKHNIPTQFLLDLESNSRQGTLRGLHYQSKHPQGKLVRVPKGNIYTVVVDLRRKSLTFGQWSHAEISSKNKKMLWIPAGFAHGFYVLSKYAKVVYKLTDVYAPQWERILAWNDPTLKIEWPLLSGREPLLSKKDTQGKFFQDLEYFEAQ